MSTDIFDYVIIGGGNAGLALAGRLTEDPSIHVCVLEAGQDVTSVPDIVVPGALQVIRITTFAHSTE